VQSSRFSKLPNSDVKRGDMREKLKGLNGGGAERSSDASEGIVLDPLEGEEEVFVGLICIEPELAAVGEDRDDASLV